MLLLKVKSSLENSNINTCPLITLLSDIGITGNYLPVAKALLIQAVPGSKIVDISHFVEEGNLIEAAYLLLAAYKRFPKGTIHVLPVDIFSGPHPKLVLTEKDGHFFLAPDNGVLSLAFGAILENEWSCFEFQKPFTFMEWIKQATGITRKIFELQKGENLSKYHGIYWQRQRLKIVKDFFDVHLKENEVECTIISIDRFGNIVLNLRESQFTEIFHDKDFRIDVARAKVITKVSNNYNDVAEGEPLCRFNDAGFLELAINRQSIAMRLNLSNLKASDLHYRRIKIFFT